MTIVTILSLALAALAVWRMLRQNAISANLSTECSDLRLEVEKTRSQTAAAVAAAEATVISLRTQLDKATASLADTSAALTATREENARLSTSLSHIEEERLEHDKILRTQFENLANDILRRNSSDFKQQNEQRLQEILSPLRDNLENFRKTVTETYSSEARERFSLSERIRELVDLNNTISREARELTTVLKGNNKVQGDWGEMVLESILEKSGLIKGEEYFIQATSDVTGNTLRDDSGKALRPDVVVNYPDGRCVVIDSKVSLKAFMDYANSDNEEGRRMASARHIKSVRAHVDELSRKNYQDFIGETKLDFVMMFIPNEPAYIAAMRIDPSLWQDAYDRKVLIVSPTHLVSGLRLIGQLWSRDKVTRNAIRIAEEAGKMYDKFADFTNDMERIEKALASASKAHGDAMTKLTDGTGNLVGRARKLQELGVKTSKQLAASASGER